MKSRWIAQDLEVTGLRSQLGLVVYRGRQVRPLPGAPSRFRTHASAFWQRRLRLAAASVSDARGATSGAHGDRDLG